MLKKYATQIDDINERYKEIEFVGNGSYGRVTKALDLKTNKIVALKRLFTNYIREERIEREITILRKLKHKHIYQLYDFLYSKQERTYYLAFEFCQHDLQALIDSNSLTTAQIKSFMKQILIALAYLHQNKIIHMDIKPENILVKDGTTIKLADFGLAREIKPDIPGPTECVTCCYRPFELFLGKAFYGTEIDIWSAGATFYQLITKNTIFSRTSKAVQVFNSILQVCGTPDIDLWPDLVNLPGYAMLTSRPKYPSKLHQFLNFGSEYEQISLQISRMLSLVPYQRPTAQELLDSGAFDTELPQNSSSYSLQELHQSFSYENFKSISFTNVVRPTLPAPYNLCY